MYLSALRLTNYRRFKDAFVALDPDMSIFVGPNNSGKTSAAQAIHLFAGDSPDQFTVHDFSVGCWSDFAKAAQSASSAPAELPRMSLDLWFAVDDKDLHLVIDLLPRLEWKGSEVGLRIEFAPRNDADLIQHYKEAEAAAQPHAQPGSNGSRGYKPWPHSIIAFLERQLSAEYVRRFYVLDRAQFDSEYRAKKDYAPQALTETADSGSNEKRRGGLQVLRSIIRIDCLHAQRYLSDFASGARAENLSARLSRFYSSNLKQRPNDHAALRALEESRDRLDEHLEKEFAEMLARLKTLGYPGIANPRIQIRASLGAAQIFGKDGATVHYALDAAPIDGESPSLPDKYSGLGFKNLVYMVVELYDYHIQWLRMQENRPPLHLVLIEEPEAHLHVQLQQVFIREVERLLTLDGENAERCRSQLIVTTHSPHMTFERGFLPIRYFRRSTGSRSNESVILNVSAFNAATEERARGFLQRYMKLTHCDLFFADAVILVEGAVEKLLLPQIVEEHCKQLSAQYLSIMEVGGAFAHRFKALLEFIGVPTLIITDLDSVDPSKNRSACPVGTAGAVTSNQTLIQWIPKETSIEKLLSANPDLRTVHPTEHQQAPVHVAYQQLLDVQHNGKSFSVAGRTFEEAFALQNLSWCQDPAQQELGLNVPDGVTLDPHELARKLHELVKNSDRFDKVDFALRLMESDPRKWSPPQYVLDGLRWLAKVLAPDEASKASDLAMPQGPSVASAHVSQGAPLKAAAIPPEPTA